MNHEWTMELRPHDVVVAVKLALLADQAWTYGQLAEQLRVSQSVAHNAVSRLDVCHLFSRERRRVNRRGLLEFVKYGLKYAFPAARGGIARGIRTAHSAEPLAGKIVQGDGLPTVWASPEGEVRGEAIEPLHATVPVLARSDDKFYEIMALVEALRVGRARERELAVQELRSRLL